MGHEHTHPHSHEHGGGHGDHAHPVEDYAARRHPEFVVLEIGDGLGALVVHTDETMHGVEIEISRRGQERDGAHKQVLERGSASSPQFTAVFDALPAGTYELWLREDASPQKDARERDVKIEDGQVTELDWRTA